MPYEMQDVMQESTSARKCESTNLVEEAYAGFGEKGYQSNQYGERANACAVSAVTENYGVLELYDSGQDNKVSYGHGDQHKSKYSGSENHGSYGHGDYNKSKYSGSENHGSYGHGDYNKSNYSGSEKHGSYGHGDYNKSNYSGSEKHGSYGHGDWQTKYSATVEQSSYGADNVRTTEGYSETTTTGFDWSDLDWGT